MKAYIFSKGETTTQLAEWSLQRLGFETVTIFSKETTFFEKYKLFLDLVLKTEDQIVVRSDADVIVHKNFKGLVNDFVEQYDVMKDEEYWWVSGKSFCFLKMELIDSCPQIISREAIIHSAANIEKFKEDNRPETALTRIAEFYDPRRFKTTDTFVGIHGYKQSEEDIARVIEQKKKRKQFKNWDHDLINKVKEF